MNGEDVDSDVMTRWVAQLSRELGIEVHDLDVQALLDLARDSAHAVLRPAAPISTFLVGYAAGRRAAMGNDITDECQRASALALAWDAAP